MDIEQQLICKAAQESDLTPVFDARIKPEWLTDEYNREVLTWMMRFYQEYSRSPDLEALLHEFPGFEVVEVAQPYAFIIDEMRKAYRLSIVGVALNESRKSMQAHDPDPVLKLFSDAVERAYTDSSALQDEDATETTEERQGYYDSLRYQNRLLGVPTGFPTMDRVTKGLQKEQMITIVGPPKGLKTAVLNHMATAAHLVGYRPLVVTFEMSIVELLARHDAMRAHVSYERLTAGALERDERDRLRKSLKAMSAMPALVYVHDPASVTTVSALAAKVNQYNPDCVYIDGAYLMDPETNVEAGTAQALTALTRSLKRLAQRQQIPIVVSTQVLRWKMRGKQVTLDSIGYTSSFAQDSDIVFGVEEENEDEGFFNLKILASRNTAKKNIKLTINFERGLLEELEPFDAEEHVDAEQY